MVDRKEPVALRNKRLFRSVICGSGLMQRSTGMKMTQDALLDAFILLYEECSKESLKKDISMTNFINKYRSLVTEIKSLRVNLSDFSMETLIGRGHFGEVRIVKEKETNDTYAMKILSKSKVVPFFEEERDIMCLNSSPWLTSLVYSFQDTKNLYFVMDYHPGGDLSSLLNKFNGAFSAEMTKFYLAEISLAIKALHQMGYVHRDIKPDNILLDRYGHVKLVDFGSAARLTASGVVNQSMPVGTPEYVAPEILLSLSNDFSDKKKKCSYGVECDYWSLGIVAYEMIVGCTPFSAEELKVVYFNIMHHKKLKYPESLNIPETLKDLIDKLLEEQSLRIKYESLIRHPFFIDINFNNIRNEAPPFVPILNSPDDTSNFIELERKKGIPKSDVKENNKEFSGKNLPFIGFTFSNENLSRIEQTMMDNVLEDKGSCLNSTLARIRRENKNLLSKLYESELGKSNELEKLKKMLEEKNKMYSIIEAHKNRLMREVAKAETEKVNLRRTLELERQDRKETELNALNLIRQNKIKLERDMGNLIGPLQAKIEEINDKLTESHTLNNELISKCDRAESELAAAKNEIERLKSLEISYKDKIAKIREMNRQSVVGLESRIEQLANDNHAQTNVLQKKLNEEIHNKNEALDKLKEMEAIFSGKEAQLKEEIQEYEDKIVQLKIKVEKQHNLIASLQIKLEEKPNIASLEQCLETEKKECVQLRLRISEMESELTNTTNSFLDHEAAIAAHEENMSALEKEFRQISEEKIELQKKLQKTKEIEEENRQKLSSLEIIVDRLEEGVIKLENENSKLRQEMINYSQPITSEAEARYQERITILEDQIAKLESQLQKMTESSLLEKEVLRVANSSLWKAEKELSDAKIDLRIAKRETKAAEDTVAKLNEEIKKMNKKIDEINEKTHEEMESERAKLEKLNLTIDSLKTELGKREKEVKLLENQLVEFEELKTSNKQLKKEYNEMCQNLKILENQMAVIKKEKGEIKTTCASLETTKLNLESVIEEMKHKICTLELNNTVLKETGSMMDEQLEDYEKFTVSQTQKIQELFQEKCFIEKELQTVKRDLSSCQQSLNEEKSFRLKAEQRVTFLESEISNAEEKITSLQLKVTTLTSVTEDLESQIKEFNERVETYELEIEEWKKMYDSLNGECQWLKEETTTHLTNLYSLRESNYKLSHSLEEEQQLVAALQEKIAELQSVITELEAFHKQREVKDEATKLQQNKLINFLQSKLDETKKKKTLSDVLFGSRSKENFPPNSEWISPSSTKTSSNLSRAKNLKVQNYSPSKKKILSQIVKSPSSQSPFQRTFSLQRMHHNIPHRFTIQLLTRTGKCEGCHSNVNRGNNISVCDHCGIQAHPKCSVTIPKTCGLPESFANHYVKCSMNPTKTVENKSDALKSSSNAIKEGWIKIPHTDNSSWERRYAKLKGEKFFIYEHEPQDEDTSPFQVWNFCPKNKIIISGVKESSGLPPTAKSDIPYIIKIAVIPENSCWPKNTYHIMVLTPADKPIWLSALNSITLNNPSVEKFVYHGTQIYSFPQHKELHINSISQINDQLLLLGAEEGLFSLKINYDGAEPIKIDGVSRVKQINVADHIGLVLMIAEENGILIETDYRSLLSNAETLSCVNPSIKVNEISLGSAVETSLMFSVSHKIDGIVYLTVATSSSRLILLKWNMKDSQFLVSRVLETLHPCNCIIYTNNSVIVGCDKFFKISFNDYFVQEFLDPAISSLAFWKIGSFPIQIFQTAPNEFLLCYNEFGVFVNENGEKILPDLKWNKVPCQFEFQRPYLFVIHKSSVEIIVLQRSDWMQTNTRSNDDTLSTTSTATIQDSIHINFNNPCLLGSSKIAGAIIVSDISNSGIVHLILIEGKKVYKNELGSSISLSTIPSENKDLPGEDELSFTSSIAQSLYEAESSTPHQSDEPDSCITYTISESDKKCSSKKAVSFL